MTPARFTECLLHIRWTPMNLARLLQCDPALVDAWESGEEEIPEKLAGWFETLATVHEATGVLSDYRGRRYGFKQ
jgi:hypothetical protein